MAWYDNIDTRGYNNYDGAQEYNPNYGRSFAGVGRFDPRNMIRPDNLTQDMGASTYTAPPVYPGSLYSPHRGFDEMQFSETVEAPEKKGFNFPSMLGMVKGGLEWLGDKFKRPEAKQKAYESIMGDRKNLGLWDTQTGTYGGNQYDLTRTPSGLKVGSDILGYGEGYAKNFDSMFGSKSLEEMEQEKLDWAAARLRDKKGLSKRLRDILKQRGITGDASKTDTAPVKTTTGITTPNVHGGGDAVPSGRHDYTRDRGGGYTLGGGFTGTRGQVGRTGSTAGTGRGHHSWRAEGGRVGYRDGEFVEDINMEGPGYDVNEQMAGFIDPQDALNDMSMDIFGKPLHELTGEEYQMLIDMANDQAMGEQDQGLASLV